MSQVRANTSFRGPGRRIVKVGEILAADDPIVAGREALFTKLLEDKASDEEPTPAKEVVRSDDDQPKKAAAKKAAARSED